MTKVITLRKYSKYKKTKNHRKKEFKKIDYQDKSKILVMIVSIVSIFIGCLIFKNNKEIAVSELENLLFTLQKGTFANTVFFFIKYEIIYFMMEFFIGTSIIGIPLIIISPAVRCIFIGFFSSFMYSQYEVKGILFCLILLFPFYAITTSSLIFATNESFYMSNSLFNTTTNRNNMKNVSIKLYLLRYLILFAINIVCSVINSFLFVSVALKFNFN